MTQYEPIIGLEVHAELLTESKMFCGCRVVDSVAAAPNTAVCPVCLGMPGMLPVINRRAVDFAIRVGLALNCAIQTHNVFARKSYFYPDLPKGYQISQYELPLCTGGWLEIELESGARKRVGIRRVHMEEDTGKLTHLEDGSSLVDYNRSGVPLLEIVSEPELHSAEEVFAYATKLRQILRYLEVNSGDMEKGVLRIEPNISIRPAGSTSFGTRTEVKNLNSFRALASATAFELERQAAVLNAGRPVVQETRGWNESRRETFSQRSKEEAEDYRYFPEPDLPPLEVSREWVAAVLAGLPELPDARVARYRASYGLSAYDAHVLADERPVAQWFEAAVEAGGEPKAVANWLINELFRLVNEHKRSLGEAGVTPVGLVEFLALLSRGEINHNTAKEVLAEMFLTGQSAPAIIAARGLGQISDEALLAAAVDRVVQGNPDQVAAFLGGKTSIRGWLVGQIMKSTGGKANPALVNSLLDAALGRLQKRQ
jgi:aspartyl-tRNA(Asn)/glutamyl-tRNA(Gln) amidotransferase subunit B